MQLLVLISWIIGLVTRHSYKPFPVKYVVVFPNPSKEMNPLDFIAGALDIWQAEVRAEHKPLLCGSHAPAVLVITLQIGLRQPQQISWKVITMMARAL